MGEVLPLLDYTGKALSKKGYQGGGARWFIVAYMGRHCTKGQNYSTGKV